MQLLLFGLSCNGSMEVVILNSDHPDRNKPTKTRSKNNAYVTE